jgi:hypothetical protein
MLCLKVKNQKKIAWPMSLLEWELGIDNANCKELLTRNESLELTMQIAKSF